MAIRRFWVQSSDIREFNTPNKHLLPGEWAWADHPVRSLKYIRNGLDTHDQPATRTIDITDPEWNTHNRPQDRKQYVGQRYVEIIIRVDFGAGDLLRGQYAISPNDPDLRWVRYFTNNGRHHRWMAPESLSIDGPPQENLTQVASPVSETFVAREITEADYLALAGPGDIAPPDCREED